MKHFYSIALCMMFLGLSSSCKQEKKENQLSEQTETITEEVTPDNAIWAYLNNDDNNYAWELKDSVNIGGTTAYNILLTSQQWREFTWKHQVTIIKPSEIKHDGALLFVTGGSVKDGEPKWSSSEKDKRAASFAHIAEKNKAIVTIIRQTPNQPLYEGLVEDQLISYTLHNFKNDKDYTWPLLFPMVKSAVKAMDLTQEFSKSKLNQKVNSFTVSGASKRGWTTWLTGATDKRVKAIAPMVIDVLNMPVSLDYHITAWNEYSIQIEDYIKLEIPQKVHTEEGDAITKMVDPYSYRSKLSMPKLIFIGTNDEYWPVDAIKHYINDIPGENYIHYVPNAGHDLGGGEQALRALSGFWAHTLNSTAYPELSYSVSEGDTQTLSVSANVDQLVKAYLWSADSEDRDFRDEEWSASDLSVNGNTIEYQIKLPKEGFKAFYIDLEYKDPNGGTYTKSSRMYLTNNESIL